MPEDTLPGDIEPRLALRDIVIETLSRAGADMARVGIDQIVSEAVERIERITRPGEPG